MYHIHVMYINIYIKDIQYLYTLAYMPVLYLHVICTSGSCVRVANVHLLKGHYLWYSLRYKIHASLIYIYMCVPMCLNMGNVTSVRYIFII